MLASCGERRVDMGPVPSRIYFGDVNGPSLVEPNLEFCFVLWTSCKCYLCWCMDDRFPKARWYSPKVYFLRNVSNFSIYAGPVYFWLSRVSSQPKVGSTESLAIILKSWSTAFFSRIRALRAWSGSIYFTADGSRATTTGVGSLLMTKLDSLRARLRPLCSRCGGITSIFWLASYNCGLKKARSSWASPAAPWKLAPWSVVLRLRPV